MQDFVLLAVKTGGDVEGASVAWRHIRGTRAAVEAAVDALEKFTDDMGTTVQAFVVPAAAAMSANEAVADIAEQLDLESNDD